MALSTYWMHDGVVKFYVYLLIEFSQQSHNNWYCYYLSFVEEETETERFHG